MTIWICATCGIEHSDTEVPPVSCEICVDERQYVPPAGQIWTTQAELAGQHGAQVTELEPDLYAIRVEPGFGIGQRTLLLRTPGGNLLWEPSGFKSPAMVDAVRALGGVAVVTASHPHLTGVSVSWSHEFGGVPVYVARDDRRWIRRPDDAITLWQDALDVLPGVTLVQVGGHFPGSSVAHWPSGAGGKGVLLSGDTLSVGADRVSVSFMRSYPNLIPLNERLVRKIAAGVEPFAYDRVYGAFDGWVIDSGAKQIVAQSARRYIGWLRDDIRDPDERI